MVPGDGAALVVAGPCCEVDSDRGALLVLEVDISRGLPRLRTETPSPSPLTPPPPPGYGRPLSQMLLGAIYIGATITRQMSFPFSPSPSSTFLHSPGSPSLPSAPPPSASFPQASTSDPTRFSHTFTWHREWAHFPLFLSFRGRPPSLSWLCPREPPGRAPRHTNIRAPVQTSEWRKCIRQD